MNKPFRGYCRHLEIEQILHNANWNYMWISEKLFSGVCTAEVYQVNMHYYTLFYSLLGRCQTNLCFHFAGNGENLPDIAKSRDATLNNKPCGSQLKVLMKQNRFLFQRISCYFFNRGLGTNCTRFSHDGGISLHPSGLTLLSSTLHHWLPLQEKSGHFVWLL